MKLTLQELGALAVAVDTLVEQPWATPTQKAAAETAYAKVRADTRGYPYKAPDA